MFCPTCEDRPPLQKGEELSPYMVNWCCPSCDELFVTLLMSKTYADRMFEPFFSHHFEHDDPACQDATD